MKSEMDLHPEVGDPIAESGAHPHADLATGTVQSPPLVCISGSAGDVEAMRPLLHAQSRPSPKSPRTAASPLRILVVDDNADSGETMALVLRLSGHDVRTADSGPAALESAREFVPEVVLMDIGMPGMDGYTAARHLRTQMVEHQPLLIALTGYTQDDHMMRAREAGFDHHLAKPVEIDALTKLLANRKA
jgi:CheY-like chemotaxis protein